MIPHGGAIRNPDGFVPIALATRFTDPEEPFSDVNVAVVWLGSTWTDQRARQCTLTVPSRTGKGFDAEDLDDLAARPLDAGGIYYL